LDVLGTASDQAPRPGPGLGPRRSWRTWLIGRPLATADAENQTIGKAVGLAVFASDALSSNAYATQEILFVLALAGAGAFGYAIPIALAIAGLLAIVAVSYWQTIHAYPDSGGAYVVARENLSLTAAAVAGAALLADYTLVVAVSVSSGAAQIVSAVPALYPWRVTISVVIVMALMVVNLRGVREAGTILSVPTYFFVFAVSLTLGTALVRYLGGGLGQVIDPPAPADHGELTAISAFLILHAFSNGTTALTGIEAIANGVSAFREPRGRNAGITLVWMAVILGTFFLGITLVSVQIGAVPAETETVISQLARTVFDGKGLGYLIVIVATTLILSMAANTAFNGFPRLGALQAEDGLLPRQLAYRGSRLVYSRGIVVLAVLAALLVVAFDASVSALIPLYAIGVFLSFTLSQAGMTRRWWKSGHLASGQELCERGSVLHHDRLWWLKMAVNGFGALCTAIVMVVFTVTKFSSGAWIVVLVIPALVVWFFAINRHYRDLGARLSLDDYGAPPRAHRHRILVPISGMNRGTMAALRYARSLSDDVTAVHVYQDAAKAEALHAEWGRWGDGVRLVTMESPYRLLIEPLLDYIEQVRSRGQRDEIMTIVVPEFVPFRAWHNLLHAQTAVMLRLALRFKPGIVITSVPYQLRRGLDAETSGGR
jgi:amino acid transporter